MASSTCVLLLGLSSPLIAAAFSSPLRISSTSLITFQHQQTLSSSHPQRRPTSGVSSPRMLDFFIPPPKTDGSASPVVSISRESDLEELLQQSMVRLPPSPTSPHDPPRSLSGPSLPLNPCWPTWNDEAFFHSDVMPPSIHHRHIVAVGSAPLELRTCENYKTQFAYAHAAPHLVSSRVINTT